MQKTNAFIAMTALSSLLITACSSSHQQDIDPSNINQLQALSAKKVDEKEGGDSAVGQIRYKAIEDTALSLGAQAGLAAASQDINAHLEQDKKYLETIFNFNGMMLSHGVLPPVLVQSDNNLNLADADTIRIADKTYKIVKQARFATTPPTWREYLWQNYEKPEIPHKLLLPNNSEERKIWSRAIRIGWEKGQQQAYSIFQQNLAMLKRDYQGMILYRKLLQENMITPPYVSKTELGVTGTGDDMRINDQVLRITEHPQLQTDSNGWRAIVVKQNDN
jgi:defect-in-organelle-trafficking protein DotC